MRRILIAFVVQLACLPLAAQPLSVGAAKRKITPLVERFTDTNRSGRYEYGEPFTDTNGNGRRDTTYIAGYATNRVATHVIHDLWARSIAVRTADRLVVLCALDLVGYMIHRVARIKRAVLAHAAKAGWPLGWGDIIVASTHNHHGPDTIGLWGPNPLISGVRPAYLARVERAAAEAIIAAIASAVPAEIRHASVRVPQAVRDIHAPTVTDPELSLLQARTPGTRGRVIATLLNYAAHPELLDSRQTGISPDYVHFVIARTEQHFGGVAAFFAGALGGMQTPPSKYGRGVRAIEQVGALLSDAAITALGKARPDPDTHCFVHTRMVLLPVDNPRFRLGIRMGLFGKGLRLRRQGRALLLPVEMSVVRIGTAELLTNPGELYPEIGNDLKQTMRGRTRFIIGLAGNEIGYILPAALWGDPRYPSHRYEESMSLGRRTGPLVRRWMTTLTRSKEADLRAGAQDLRAQLESLLPRTPRNK